MINPISSWIDLCELHVAFDTRPLWQKFVPPELDFSPILCHILSSNSRKNYQTRTPTQSINVMQYFCIRRRPYGSQVTDKLPGYSEQTMRMNRRESGDVNLSKGDTFGTFPSVCLSSGWKNYAMLVTINIQQLLCTVINLHVAIQSSSTLPFITNLTNFMSVRISRT